MNYLVNLNNGVHDCCNCKLNYENEYSQTCCVLTNDIVKNSKCRLVELKPPQIIWKETDKIGADIVFMSISTYEDFKYVLRVKASHTIDIFFGFERIEQGFGEFMKKDDNISKAKEFCQSHCDRLFNEMIGVRI